MKQAAITEVKNGLSALIDRVRAGETVLITDRGIPVARIEPVVGLPDATGRLRRLERSGVIRAGTSPAPLEMIRQPGPELAGGSSAVAALLEERRSDR